MDDVSLQHDIFYCFYQDDEVVDALVHQGVMHLFTCGWAPVLDIYEHLGDWTWLDVVILHTPGSPVLNHLWLRGRFSRVRVPHHAVPFRTIVYQCSALNNTSPATMLMLNWSFLYGASMYGKFYIRLGQKCADHHTSSFTMCKPQNKMTLKIRAMGKPQTFSVTSWNIALLFLNLETIAWCWMAETQVETGAGMEISRS